MYDNKTRKMVQRDLARLAGVSTRKEMREVAYRAQIERTTPLPGTFEQSVHAEIDQTDGDFFTDEAYEKLILNKTVEG